MCILFLKFVDPAGNVPGAPGAVTGAPGGRYKLVLAANRDEYYQRPAKAAHFWGENPRVLSGVDMEPGREGGTWLGMAETGRLSALTNILQPSPDPNAKGRGSLITDFLRGDQTPLAYLEDLAKEGHLFNGFNLVTMDLSKDTSLAYYYSNVSQDGPKVLSPGQYVISNSLLHTPFQKASNGKKLFREILREKEEGNRDAFIESLLQLLDNNVQFPDDPQVKLQGTHLPETVRHGYTAIRVRTPRAANYGTRTNTVILVDQDNHVTFLEKTMKQPIDIDNPEWEVNKFELDIESRLTKSRI
ncbi:transport and Golgi organization protein 2 homolog [Branchiostoma floridae]|uniref:Transport and Golgi organization protein 2 homolog n=1 Tax=Branchiostoma floridae TaxID=7739 RepID=A0A9J7LDJ0_BRAFL|nr:transport and Golgi organization protein 2 homolog [Branchiostoma floridae]